MAASLKTEKPFPCVALIGPRQVGKTTLAKKIREFYPQSIYLDLELRSDLIRLEDPKTYLGQFNDRLIIIDEVQRKSERVPVLRTYGFLEDFRIPS